MNSIFKKYYIIGGIVAIALFMAMGYLIGTVKTSGDVVGQLTNNIQVQIDNQYKERLVVLQKALDDRNKEVLESRMREKVLLSNLGKLQRDKEDVKLPTSNEELDIRINALGLKPIIR